jgi:hypothetical protein
MYQQMHYLLLESLQKVFTIKLTLLLLQHVSVLDHRQGAYSCALLKLYYVKSVAACQGMACVYTHAIP